MKTERRYELIREEDLASGKHRKCLAVKCYVNGEKFAQDILLKTNWMNEEEKGLYPYSFMIDAIHFAKELMTLEEEK
jgi:hypothetical protein